jgi:phage-related minor tail protein
MLNPKTHFEQVPVKTVRKMMEEQTRQSTAAVDALATQKTILEEGPAETKELPVSFHAISHVEA